MLDAPDSGTVGGGRGGPGWELFAYGPDVGPGTGAGEGRQGVCGGAEGGEFGGGEEGADYGEAIFLQLAEEGGGVAGFLGHFWVI